MDLTDQMRRWIDELEGARLSVRYVVLDHSCPPGTIHESYDARGERYVACSPSVMDTVRHHKWYGVNVIANPLGWVAPLDGVPVYRRQDLGANWPDG